MSIEQRISYKALPIETFNRFQARFNVLPNKYSFDIAEEPTNGRQLVIPMNNRYIYLIDRVSFSSSIDEGVYLRSIDVQPDLRLQLRLQSAFLYPYPLPAINYKDNLEFNFWFHSNKANDQLLVSMSGILDQVPETVGVSTIYSHISFIIYQEENVDLIEKLRAGKIPHTKGRLFSG